jgi:hypothetical protein
MADKKNSTNETPISETQISGIANTNLPVVNQGGFIDLEALGMSADELASLSGLDGALNDFRIPYATLISKDTREHKKGDVVFSDGKIIRGWSGEELPGISVLTCKTVRVYFPTPFNANNTFICRSIDGYVGYKDGAYPGQECSSCEFSKYPQTGGASPCREQRLLLCTREDGHIFHLQIGGVGVKEWNTFLNSQMLLLLPKSRIVPNGKPILGRFNLTLSVKEVDTPNGMFPALQFKPDPQQLFVSNERLKGNLDLLKTYRDLEERHAETAAVATKHSMAINSESNEVTANSDLF